MARAKKAAIIAVANQKGGVAKTTSVASIGAAMAELGKRVLLVDLDPQASLTFSLGIDPDAVELSVNEVVLGQAEIADAISTGVGESIDKRTIALGNPIKSLGAHQVSVKLHDEVSATAALNGPDDCIHEMRATYRRRRDAMVDAFQKTGWDIPVPSASMFAWVPIPERYRSLGSLEFSKLLLEKSDVAVAPGVGFGEFGDDYVRIALVENEQRIRQAARNVRRFFDGTDKTLHNVVPIAKAG